MSECNTQPLLFQPHERRDVAADFDDGTITSDAGGLLLREVELRFGIIRQFAGCFTDHRDEQLIEFSPLELLLQRVMGLALGYEDLNDHEQLRHDSLLALLCGRKDITGSNRPDLRDRDMPLAGKSTLNRLELTPAGAGEKSRYKKIVAHIGQLHNALVDLFIRLRAKQGVPEELILDFDATDDPIHGDQLGKFFHGYYKNYCYLPLYAFCDGWPLLALLRPSDLDASEGTVEQLARIVPRLRQAWPQVRIIVRGDSGFCRESIMAWCEAHHVDYVFGLAKNRRLQRIIGRELQTAQQLFEQTFDSARVFKDFEYRTHQSWSRSRRVISKAEHLVKGSNPRFVVTSLCPERIPARVLYEDLYCARGEMENRIKEQQLFLFADRTSTHAMRSNQLRVLFSTMAYPLHQALRQFGLQGTSLARAQVHTIRNTLLKIGGRIRVSGAAWCSRSHWRTLTETCSSRS
ncbi:IS1380 family transposase [Planctomicrobium piriforme]|uniref:Transposase DDE domain group 1 n=1 Tax=Planctomicrobium piriforme TaxID=1576369 RepID=A0A1I3RDN8_9PLAN|nr:Transposase DDE domain group 1 [Planctomicrobium piriforme]